MISSREKFDVVISGGSFAGMALARGLSLASDGGMRIAIVDRLAPPGATKDGRAFAIWNGAKQVLDGLGVWTRIAEDVQSITSIEITDSALEDGVRPTRLTYDATLDDGQPAAFMVSAAALQEALRASLANDAAITWFAPAEAVALRLGDHFAGIDLSDSRTIDAALCVAADGRSSRLRDAAGIKTVGWDYGQIGLVATVVFETPHDGVAIQHFLPGGPFAILPLQDNRACITWSAAREDALRIIALDDEAFVAELDARIGGRFGAIRLDGPRQSWPLDFKVPRDLVSRRFVLVGDAAHGVHPVAGQGVNLAFRDAAALVECVIDAMRIGFDAGHAPALERYSRWRRFDSMMSASIYDGLNRMFSVDSAVLRAGRGAGLGVLDGNSPAKRWILSEASGKTGDLPKLMRGVAV